MPWEPTIKSSFGFDMDTLSQEELVEHLSYNIPPKDVWNTMTHDQKVKALEMARQFICWLEENCVDCPIGVGCAYINVGKMTVERADVIWSECRVKLGIEMFELL